MASTASDPDVFDEHLAAFKTQTGDVRDPYEGFALAREHQPVSEQDLVPRGEDGGPRRRTFMVFAYDDCDRLLRDPETFSSRVHEDSMGEVFGHSILEMDAPEHNRHRALVSRAFRPRVIETWNEQVVAPLAHRLIDEFADRGEADLVREFTFELPVRVIAHILGVPEQDVPQFHEWALTISNTAAGMDNSRAARAAVEDYFRPLIEQRRHDPGVDLVSQLATVEVDGQRLETEEIFPFVNLLTSAGAETTFCSTGNLLYGLLADPDQLRAVVADRELLPRAIEEGLRWEAAVNIIPRLVTRDVDIAGVTVPADAQVLAVLGSANRDESRWEQPDRFDIWREQKHHLAFAAGPHACIGMHLARIEMRTALNALFDRVSDLRLHPDAEDVHVHGFVFRTPFELPVVFDRD